MLAEKKKKIFGSMMESIGCIGLISLSLRAAPLLASHYPPIGERLYCVQEGKETGFGKATIKSAKAIKKQTLDNGVLCFKDPRLETKDAESESPQLSTSDKLAEEVHPPSQLRIAPLQIKGNIKQPRVKFSPKTLPLGRADESLPENFVNKIFKKFPDL